MNEFKKFKFQIRFVLEYKNQNDYKIFHLSAKVITSDSEIDETVESMYQNIMTKIKNSSNTDLIAIKTIVKHSIKVFDLVFLDFIAVVISLGTVNTFIFFVG